MAGTLHQSATRVAGLLFVLGGLLGLLSLLLPHPESSDDTVLAAIDACAFVAGGVLLALGGRAPGWLVHLVSAGASAMICAAIYFTGVATGIYSTMFVWIVLFSAYFFSIRALAAHLAWILGCYAGVLAALGNAGGYSALTRWLLTSIALGVAGGVTAWLVTARRKVEERARSFFDLSRDLLCTASADGHLLELNPAWTRVLGYSPDELRARPFADFVHPDDRERTEEEAARIFEGGGTVSFQSRYRAKDGSWRWLDWSSTRSCRGSSLARAGGASTCARR